MTLPTADGFRMPAEWESHTRCWMAWPCHKDTFGPIFVEARAAYAAVAREIARFEPVTMIARPEHASNARRQCGPTVEIVELPLDDSWTRDTGPTFLIDGAGRLAGADWRHNAWGGNYSDHGDDAKLAARILERIGAQRYAADFVLEGGAFHTDGDGTLLTTESVLLNPNRNPGMTRGQAETVLRDWLGIQTVIWLGDGVQGDHTDGHIDNLACFARPGVVLALACADAADPNHAPLADNIARLRAATDGRGRKLEVIEIEQPGPKWDWDQRIPGSYINFYLPNGGIVIPSFDDPADGPAREIIQAAFPDRKLVQIRATDITRGGGGIHCITQQQPAV